jgi:hypothetical protein
MAKTLTLPEVKTRLPKRGRACRSVRRRSWSRKTAGRLPFSSASRSSVLEPVNDRDHLRGIGGDETQLIALPQRHDEYRSLCRWSLKQRHTVATTEKDCEQTDCSAHGHRSVNLCVLLQACGEVRRGLNC